MQSLPSPETLSELSVLQQALGVYRYRVSSEQCLHEGVALALTAAGLSFEHEYVASAGCRFDFFLPKSEIVLELKIAGTYADALRQAKRYLELPVCKAVLIASNKLWAPMDPVDSEDIVLSAKPIRVMRLATRVFS